MTLSAVGSVFSSSDDHQNNNNNNSSIINSNNNNVLSSPKHSNSTLQYQLQTPTHKLSQSTTNQLTPIQSPPSTISSVGGIHNTSLTSDLSFTPPHAYTQLNILSSHNKNNNNNNQNQIISHKVSEKLHDLSSSLEHLIGNIVTNDDLFTKQKETEEEEEINFQRTNDITAQRIKEHLLPEIVSRLRYLSGVLDGTIEISEYEETFGSGTIIENKNIQQHQEKEKEANNKNNNKKDNEDNEDEEEDSESDSCVSPSSIQSPIRNTSRLIPSQFDSDDSLLSTSPPHPHPSTIFLPQTSKTSTTPTTNSNNSTLHNIKLNDWGVGRENNEKDTLITDELDEDSLSNISPIQILYSKPSSLPTTSTQQQQHQNRSNNNNGISKKIIVPSKSSEHPL